MEDAAADLQDDACEYEMCEATCSVLHALQNDEQQGLCVRGEAGGRTPPDNVQGGGEHMPSLPHVLVANDDHGGSGKRVARGWAVAKGTKGTKGTKVCRLTVWGGGRSASPKAPVLWEGNTSRLKCGDCSATETLSSRGAGTLRWSVAAKLSSTASPLCAAQSTEGGTCPSRPGGRRGGSSRGRRRFRPRGPRARHQTAPRTAGSQSTGAAARCSGAPRR
mmetsp:Transcript_5693/g.12357  ORF Transcript_5693/g.12357 Transcript_5693/m.12357 type:complete len:220 (-) Transcript_5693:769-1428(-)